MSVPDDIILGDGVFSIGSSSSSVTAIGLTKGGGSFKLEREIKNIEADGDYGPVKGRQRIVKEIPKLNIKCLEIVPANMDDYYPGLTVTATTSSTTISTRSFTTNITSADYTWVQWAGYTKGGDSVLIGIENAINLEGIDWSLVSKEEVINELNYTGTYLETARNTSPWAVIYT